jgi:ketosteroid isomerase-like protein
MTRITCAATVLLATASYAQPAPQSVTEADRQAISAVREAELAAFSTGDVEKLLTLLTDDVVSMPPGEPTVVGKEAARGWVQRTHKQFKVEGRYTSTADLTVIGDWAFERMAFRLKLTPVEGGAPVEEVGKGLHVYRREAGGAWKIAQDIWNSDEPAPVAK